MLPFAGMQSSLLALALANRFFQDPLVGVPPAISVSQYASIFPLLFLVTPLTRNRMQIMLPFCLKVKGTFLSMLVEDGCSSKRLLRRASQYFCSYLSGFWLENGFVGAE